MFFLPLCVALLAAIPTSLAQAQDINYITGLLQALQGAGLFKLSSVASVVNNTAIGRNLLAELPSQKQLTIFAPNDQAFKNASTNLTTNTPLLADTLAYHVISGNFSAQTMAFPNITLGRTFLNDSSLVHLEGGKAQVLAWTKMDDGKVYILNQPTNVTVLSSTTYANIEINIIDNILTIPGNLSTILTPLQAAIPSYSTSTTPTPTTSNSTTSNITLADTLSQANGVHGFTLFLPNDAALSGAAAMLAALEKNQTSLTAVIQNHIINGTSVYSPLLTSTANLTSAAGEPLTFLTNSSGTYVESGGASARLVQTDVLVSNGVVHIVDAVLVNAESDAGAAVSAYQSATSVAAVKTTETLAIGATATSGALGLWAGVGRGLGWVREVVVVLGTVVVGGLVV